MKQIIIIIVATVLYSNTGFSQQVKLTLDEALRLALTENKTIQIGQLDSKKSEEVIKEKRSYLLPLVSGNANYSAFVQRPVIFLRDGAGSKEVRPVEVGGTNAFNSGVVASYPLLDLQKRSEIKLATINSELEREKTKDLSGQILLEVGVTYFTVQFYNEQVSIYTQSLDRNIRALTDSRLLFLQGKGLKTDTLRHYLDVQNLEAAISSLRNESNKQLMHLKNLLGLEMNVPIQIADPLSAGRSPLTDNIDSLITMAINTRPDVKVQEFGVSKANQVLAGVRSEVKPAINAYAQYQLQAQSDKISFWNYSYPNTAFVGIQLSIPIYSGNRVRYRRAAANIGIQQAQIQLQDLREQIQKEIKTLAGNLNDAHVQADIYAKSVELAQVNFNMVRDRYKHGISTRLEVADAEVVLLQARMNHIKSIYIVSITQLQIKKALGLM